MIDKSFKEFGPKENDIYNNGSISLKLKVLWDEIELWWIKTNNETYESYMDKLVKKLNSPKKLKLFFDKYFKYTKDVNSSWKKIENWQTPQETIKRIEDWKMLWDCDDYAFLARDILRKQWKNAEVIWVPWHAICVWFEVNEGWKYDAYTIWTFWLDKNWKWIDDKNKTLLEAVSLDWFFDINSAFNSVLEKYIFTVNAVLEENWLEKIEKINLTRDVKILNISDSWEREYNSISFFYWDVEQINLVNKFNPLLKKIKKLIESWDQEKAFNLFIENWLKNRNSQDNEVILSTFMDIFWKKDLEDKLLKILKENPKNSFIYEMLWVVKWEMSLSAIPKEKLNNNDLKDSSLNNEFNDDLEVFRNAIENWSKSTYVFKKFFIINVLKGNTKDVLELLDDIEDLSIKKRIDIYERILYFYDEWLKIQEKIIAAVKRSLENALLLK